MRVKNYGDFWQDIHKHAKDKGVPLRVMFELTYRCNFKCPHCYIPKSFVEKYNTRELTTDGVSSILSQLRDAGCFYLGFTGGEPFMREDFNKILKHAKYLGFEIIIYSNGFLIGRKEAKYLKDIGVNKVDITIPGMSEKVFEAVSGVSGSHKKVFQAIDFLRKNGVPLGFKSCLLKSNEGEIKAIEKFACDLNAPFRICDELSPILGSSRKPCAMNCSACGAGISQAGITPSGELKRCVMLEKPKYKILNRVKEPKGRRGKGLLGFKRAWERLKKHIK